MAHMIETMAYTGAAPWHGLGVPVSNDLTPEEMRIAAGINWTLLKQPVFAQTPDGQMVAIPNRWSLMRDTDAKTFDIVSDLYTPTQPTEAFEFFRRFVIAGDMTMETAGSLGDGRRIWGLAKINDGFTLAGGDRVEGYLLLCSPNTAGACLEIKFTSVRVVCHNTLTSALSGGSAFRMAHWHAFDDRMREKAETALGIAREQVKAMAAAAEVLAATPARIERVYEYVARIFQPDLIGAAAGAGFLDAAVVEQATAADMAEVLAETADAAAEGAGKRSLQWDDFGRTGRTVLDAILNSPGSDLKSAQGTWWGALNGVTHAIDHTLGRADTRLEQAWFGHREAKKATALELAIEYANAN